MNAPPNGLDADRLSVHAAWSVLEAANDLGDTEMVAVCQRVIDATLGGRVASQADTRLIEDYFK